MTTTEDTEDTELFESNSLSEAIIGAVINVHRELGPGLLNRFMNKLFFL